jgi:hypothetical protein
MEQIDWADFLKVELRVGRIIQAEVFEQAHKPAYILHVDFGLRTGRNFKPPRFLGHSFCLIGTWCMGRIKN